MTSEEASRVGAPDELRELAMRHKDVIDQPTVVASYRALPGLDGWLAKVRHYCGDPVQEHARAADWLLDNDYHVARALRRVQEDLPLNFYRQLPALESTQEAKVPRAYALSEVVFDSLHPQLTLDLLTACIRAYQQRVHLTNAELWALPSLLRLVCLERLISAFVSLDGSLAPQGRLGTDGQDLSAEDATDQIARAITNLIAIHGIEWKDFVDQVSPIEAALSDDPAGIYASMTFETRNRYRQAVERLARRSEHSEVDVAQLVLSTCRRAGGEPVNSHVGYWLIGDGLSTFESELGYRPTLALGLRRRLARHRGKLYAAGLITGVLAALALPSAYLWAQNASLVQWVIGIAISLLPATILSVWAAHWVITKVIAL